MGTRSHPRYTLVTTCEAAGHAGECSSSGGIRCGVDRINGGVAGESAGSQIDVIKTSRGEVVN